MDIELPEMRGVEATKIIRQYESEYEWIHTNVVAVTVNVVNMKGIIMSNFFRGW